MQIKKAILPGIGVLAILVAGGLSACGSYQQAQLPPGNVQHGQVVFNNTCAKCHSLTDQSPNGPSLQHVGSHLTADKLQLIIDNGIGSMDGGTAQGQDEADVIAYLETLK